MDDIPQRQRLLTIEQTTLYCGISRTTLWRAVRRGELRPIYVFDDRPRFDIHHIDAYIAERGRMDSELAGVQNSARRRRRL